MQQPLTQKITYTKNISRKTFKKICKVDQVNIVILNYLFRNNFVV